MTLISKHSLELLKEKVDLVEVVTSFIKLNKAIVILSNLSYIPNLKYKELP